MQSFFSLSFFHLLPLKPSSLSPSSLSFLLTPFHTFPLRPWRTKSRLRRTFHRWLRGRGQQRQEASHLRWALGISTDTWCYATWRAVNHGFTFHQHQSYPSLNHQSSNFFPGINDFEAVQSGPQKWTASRLCWIQSPKWRLQDPSPWHESEWGLWTNRYESNESKPIESDRIRANPILVKFLELLHGLHKEELKLITGLPRRDHVQLGRRQTLRFVLDSQLHSSDPFYAVIRQVREVSQRTPDKEWGTKNRSWEQRKRNIKLNQIDQCQTPTGDAFLHGLIWAMLLRSWFNHKSTVLETLGTIPLCWLTIKWAIQCENSTPAGSTSPGWGHIAGAGG